MDFYILSKFGCDGYDTLARYRVQLRTWATSRNWEVDHDGNMIFVMKKNMGPFLLSLVPGHDFFSFITR